MNIKSRLKFLFIIFAISLYGCEIQTNNQVQLSSNQSEEPHSAIIWNRLRNNFALNLASDNSYVQFHAAKYKKQDKYLQQVTSNANPYLSHIVEQLEKRKMPGELALLPMIESSYNPFAISNMGAAGIWQLGKTTGKRYGLKQTNWHDGRQDLAAATDAALNYLQFLHKEFDGDWFLALAAYNAGEGRVHRAIQRNLAENKPIDFWSLTLPKQTKNYVPKLLALANLIKHANINELALAPIKIRSFHIRLAKNNYKKYPA
jgi:membrane-bound lytic murein transglycosylase D